MIGKEDKDGQIKFLKEALLKVNGEVKNFTKDFAAQAYGGRFDKKVSIFDLDRKVDDMVQKAIFEITY